MGKERERLRQFWRDREQARALAAAREQLRAYGPAANVAIQIRAKGVVIRNGLRSMCPNCESAMSERDALNGRGTGHYPRPPRGTLGYMCPRCAHVEYVRAPGWRGGVRRCVADWFRRLGAALRGEVVPPLPPRKRGG